MRRPQRPSRRAITVTASIVSVPVIALLLWLVFTPNRIEQWAPETISGGLDLLRTWGLTRLTLAQAEQIANIAVFIPIGLLSFVLLRERVRWLCFVIPPALSGVIELVQELFLPDRVASLQDIALNTIGGYIGVLLAWTIARLLPRRPATLSRNP